MNHVADPERYDGTMRYRRTGRSGLDLPVLSLGYWHNFGLRREALLVRVEVEDLHQPAVAAVGLKLRAA